MQILQESLEILFRQNREKKIEPNRLRILRVGGSDKHPILPDTNLSVVNCDLISE